jgi:hypothetical protein
VYTLPLRVRSRGRAPARPIGFPTPLVPHINCKPRRPLLTERWDWVICQNALWVNRLWSAIYPYRTWGQKPRTPPSSSCPKAKAPEKGTLAVFSAHRSPERHPHVIHSLTISRKLKHSMFVNFGELFAPLISAAPRPPYGDGSRQPEAPTLGPCHRPSDKPLISVSFPSALPSRYFGELSAPLVQKRMTRGPSTLVHLSKTSSDERNR